MCALVLARAVAKSSESSAGSKVASNDRSNVKDLKGIMKKFKLEMSSRDKTVRKAKLLGRDEAISE
jgi:hypothetical protein